MKGERQEKIGRQITVVTAGVSGQKEQRGTGKV